MGDGGARAPTDTGRGAINARRRTRGEESGRCRWIVLGFLLLSLACDGSTTAVSELASTHEPTTPPTPTAAMPSLLVGLEGEVVLRRLDWYDFQPVYLGTELRPGDLIRVPAGGQALVLCGDRVGTGQDPLSTVQGGEGGLPCRAFKPGPRGELAPARAVSAVIPYIIFPRNTRLLNPRPTLRWHTLTNVPSYMVSLIGDQTVLGPLEVGGGELAFPTDWPSLLPGQSYRVVVEAEESSSEEEQGAGGSFVVVEEHEATEIRALQTEVAQLSLSEVPLRLSLAHLFAARGLYGEATGMLEGVAGGSDEPAVCDLLGDLYLTVGLPQEAESWYPCALNLFGEKGITEGQAEALAGLGLVYHGLGNAEAARSQWEQAQGYYEALGDRVGVKKVGAWLDTLRP
jgi:hypothetical protein